MTLTSSIPAAKDNARSTISGAINASVTSIPLATGEGSRFPQPYNGTCTSLGSSILLNSTGISAAVGGSAVVGKPIFNATDGSIAFIKSVATDAITTTPLLGGSDNTWQNSDAWRIDEFIGTLEPVSGADTREQVLIIARNTDTLTVATGGRGFNGTSAASWLSGDYFRLLVTSPHVTRIADELYLLAKQAETDETNITTNATAITNIRSGSDFFVTAAGAGNAFTGTLSNLPAAYTTSERFTFLANHTISGSATFNRAGLGAKTLKKRTGSGLSNLSANEIQSGDLVEIAYDGTYYQILSHISAAASVQDDDVVKISVADSSAVGASSTAEANLDVNTSLATTDFVVGYYYRIRCRCRYTMNSGNLTIRVKLGTTQIAGWSTTVTGTKEAWIDVGFAVRAIGASGSVQPDGFMIAGTSIDTGLGAGTWGPYTIDTTTSQTLQVSAQFSASDAGHSCKSVTFTVERLNV